MPPSGLAASTMPFDSMPISFAGFRLATMATWRPTSASASYASAMPATIVRLLGAEIDLDLHQLLGVRHALGRQRSCATRRSIFMNSSIEMRVSAAGSRRRRGTGWRGSRRGRCAAPVERLWVVRSLVSPWSSSAAVSRLRAAATTASLRARSAGRSTARRRRSRAAVRRARAARRRAAESRRPHPA